MALSSVDPRMPDPLREHPPADRFCDLVLNGGVASGVVYPWALLELARGFRFRSIGGNSVGAMAAALAAAAEYGRCHGQDDAFEPLRQMPLKLAEPHRAGTRMLSLFQPSPPVARLFALFLSAVRCANLPSPDTCSASSTGPDGRTAAAGPATTVGNGAVAANDVSAGEGDGSAAPGKTACCSCRFIVELLRLYNAWLPLVGIPALTIWAVASTDSLRSVVVVALGLAATVLVTSLFIGWQLYCDLTALTRNAYGLCTGRGQGPREEALVEWLHKGIQRSCGRGREDPPLTFADLWAAPRFGRRGPAPLDGGREPPDAGIRLRMFSSNVTLARPVRLPLDDANTRLYYHPAEWEAYFPPTVMLALQRASRPYQPASRSDPDPAVDEDPEHVALMSALRELPAAGMPIVVAARLSLCFPILFSCVPVYAVDYEAPQRQRRLRRCLLSDGGLCSNFPIHLFDAAHPQWPTFALLLDKRLRHYQHSSVWRPKTHLEGRGDNWQRAVPGAGVGEAAKDTPGGRLAGLLVGILLTMKDWNDRVTGRLPQVRNRVVRLALEPGEGQLNIAMPRDTILRMAHQYGTRAGRELVKDFAPDRAGIKPAWREYLYVRSMVELRALRAHLKGYTRAVRGRASTVPLEELLEDAVRHPPLAVREDRPDPTADRLTSAELESLKRVVRSVQALEAELAACEPRFGPYRPVLEPELRLRPPV